MLNQEISLVVSEDVSRGSLESCSVKLETRHLPTTPFSNSCGGRSENLETGTHGGMERGDLGA